MAQRRMFSKLIVQTDAFMEMPASSQLLYFHLSMEADDDGFVSNPKRVMKTVGSGEDDYKVLMAKRFIIQFESGVCVIKHWLIHNFIRGDRYKKTQWVEEMSKIKIDEKTSKYQLKTSGMTLGIPNDIPTVDPGKGRVGKDRVGKVNSLQTPTVFVEESKEAKNSFLAARISAVIKAFEPINPAAKTWYPNKGQRTAAQNLIETYGFDETIKTITQILPQTNKTAFFPHVDNPYTLFNKWTAITDAISKLSRQQKGGNIEVAVKEDGSPIKDYDKDAIIIETTYKR